MKHLAIITLIVLSGCATQVGWHIDLETMNQQGMWRTVEQYPGSVEINVDGESNRYFSKCRQNVLFQVQVLSENGYDKFRYSVGPVVNGEYHPIQYFSSYTQAIRWYDGLTEEDREIISNVR